MLKVISAVEAEAGRRRSSRGASLPHGHVEITVARLSSARLEGLAMTGIKINCSTRAVGTLEKQYE